jgi:N-acyl homoserine lactone hydrolase
VWPGAGRGAIRPPEVRRHTRSGRTPTAAADDQPETGPLSQATDDWTPQLCAALTLAQTAKGMFPPMRIDRLLLSEVVLPTEHPRAGSACPVFAYLIHHPSGAILVDTGVGHGNGDIERLFAPVHHSIDAALEVYGVQRGDVAVVINSHLHFDHCGNNRLFPAATLVAQRAEYDLAHDPGYTVPEWVDFPGAQWELVDGETEILPGVVLLPTPGHTPGHQSVITTSGSAIDVVAAQAVYDSDELTAEASSEPLTVAEAEATTTSARMIKRVRPRNVYFSHDPRVWRGSAAGVQQGRGGWVARP